MKPTKISFLFAVLMSMAGVKAFAYDIENNGIYYNYISGGLEVTFRYIGTNNSTYSGSVIIPESVTFNNGTTFKVTSIGHNAFNHCRGLTSVIIPNSVVRIGYGAFSDCSVLASVTIGNGVTDICEWAFSSCRSLLSIIIPNSVISIDNYAFFECSSLTSVTIGNNVKSIGYEAFEDCSRLQTITIPNSMMGIGRYAFKNCKSLTSVTIGNSVTEIEEGTFFGCKNLTSIKIPNSVTRIGSYAFCDCNGVTSITMGNSVKSIGTKSFFDCSNLATLNIPNSVTSISQEAFSGCSNLTSITIGSGLGSIGHYAFNGCTSLKKVIVPDIATWCCGIWFGNEYANPLYYAHHLYSNEETEITALVIPGSMTNIGGFAYCEGLTSVTFSNNVETIRPGAFLNCRNLTTLIFPNRVRNIESYAFEGCSNLTDVYCYSKSVPQISSDAFDGSSVNHATLHVPYGSINAYKTTSPWSRFGNILAIEGILATGISLDHTSLSFNAVYKNATLTATVMPSNASYKDVIWASSNTSIATVSDAGVVTSKGSGTAIITATTTDGTNLTATCRVTVTIPATGITLNKTTLSFNAVNQTATIVATITPSNATNKDVTWTSSNTSVATVSDAGVVTAKGNGTATIAAKTADGTNLTATCTVIIYEENLMNIVTSNAGYATFFDSHHDNVLPNGLSALIVTNVSNNRLTYKTIADGNTAGVVPMGTAVILVSDERRSKSFTLTATTGGAYYSGTNLLHGSDVTTMTTGNGYHYKLSYGKTGTSWDNVFGWYWGAQDGSPFQIEGHKAWLVVPSGSTRAEAFTIDGDATEITDIEPDKSSDVYYDIQGRRVCTPTRSGLYIKNDKKIIIK